MKEEKEPLDEGPVVAKPINQSPWWLKEKDVARALEETIPGWYGTTKQKPLADAQQHLH